MNKLVPYLVGGLLLLLLGGLLLSTARKTERRFDERITLRQSDKIPYGTRAARELVPALVPNARLLFNRQAPDRWDSLDANQGGQAVLLMADYFDADESELEALRRFVEAGNTVFMVFRETGKTTAQYFDLDLTDAGPYSFGTDDSLQLRLASPAFADPALYTYPGKPYGAFFSRINAGTTVVLGRDGAGRANFVQLALGAGKFYLHSVPLAFSNYFLLYKNNAAYYQQVLSVLPPETHTLLWNEYFLEKPRSAQNQDDPNWLKALFSYPSFKWGLLTAAATLGLFVLLGMRRRQRMIPPYAKPKNESLEFVTTLGRLYYDRRDHQNLASKMAAYFLEHVRSVYKLPTHTLDEAFVQALHQKSGYPLPETQALVEAVTYIHSVNFIPEPELAGFHRRLERFYQNT